MNAYEGTGMTPQIETSDNAFKVILPNLNAKTEEKEPENEIRKMLFLQRSICLMYDWIYLPSV